MAFAPSGAMLSRTLTKASANYRNDSWDLVDAVNNGNRALADVKTEDWDELVAVNLRGAFLCCRAVLPAMTARRRGTIINIGSVVTSRTLQGTGAYTAAKYGLLGFSRVLAEEMRTHGVRVGVLSAGATDTPLWEAVAQPPDRALMLRPSLIAEAALLMAALAPGAALEELTLLPQGGVL